MTKTQKEFINTMIKAIEPYGITPELKRVILCQGVLESGYGEKGINVRGADYNVFGLNWYNDEYTKPYKHIELTCTQERDGKIIEQKESFCVFNSYTQAVYCLIHWYDRSYYAGVKDQDATHEDIIDIISNHYATSSSYAKSLTRLYNQLKCDKMFITASKTIISCGVWSVKAYADNMYLKLNTNGFDAYEYKDIPGWRVVVKSADVEKTTKKLKNMNVKYYIM